MVDQHDAATLHAARAAAVALHQALRVRRQHPDAAALWTRALRSCTDAVAAATRDRPLVLSLRPGALQVAGRVVLDYRPHEQPFAALRDAGVGELVLGRGIPAAAVAELLVRLGAVTGGDDPERAIATIVGAGDLVHVQLRAAPAFDPIDPEPVGARAIGSSPPGRGRDESGRDRACPESADQEWAGRSDADDRDAGSDDWQLLPGPAAAAAALRPLVARDLAANLTALAARQCLDDLETDAGAGAGTLTDLFARLLADGDLATATWLLAEVEHHAHVPPGVRRRLHEAALARADTAWLRHRLAQGTRDDLLALAAFALQLGDDVAGRLVRLAATHPLGRWLRDLLGQA